jgi:hypothetical protein
MLCSNVLYVFIADPVVTGSEARALIALTLDRGFESHLGHGCLSSSWYVGPCDELIVKGVLPYVEID